MWFARRYGELARLLPAFAGTVDDGARAAVDALGPVRRVLDVGCGAGRHAILLAEAGVDVVGVDLDASLLERAQAAWTDRNTTPGPRWVQADMRALPDLGHFDVACFFDVAFGVFDDDATHVDVLRALPSDRVVLELYDVDAWTEPRDQDFTFEGRRILRSYRYRDGRVEDDVSVDGVSVEQQSLRAFRPAEITEVLAAAGFRPPTLSPLPHGFVRVEARRAG